MNRVAETHRPCGCAIWLECEHRPDYRAPDAQGKPMKAADICAEAARLVGGERDRTHGSKLQNFVNIAELWNAYLAIAEGPKLTPVDVGHMMALMKIARTQHGEFNLDDYIDGAGYLGCAGEIAAMEAGLPPDPSTTTGGDGANAAATTRRA